MGCNLGCCLDLEYHSVLYQMMCAITIPAPSDCCTYIYIHIYRPCGIKVGHHYCVTFASGSIHVDDLNLGGPMWTLLPDNLPLLAPCAGITSAAFTSERERLLQVACTRFQ